MEFHYLQFFKNKLPSSSLLRSLGLCSIPIPAMQRSLLSGRTAAPAPALTTTIQASTRVVVRAAASSSSSDSPSSPSSSLPTRREALALGAASLALSGLGSGVVSTPSARAEEGGEEGKGI